MEPILVVNLILLWVIVTFNILFTLGLARRIRSISQKAEIELLKSGQPAPDFSAYTAYTLDGQTVKLADYAGQAVAFLFVSPHCQPCRDQLPAIPALNAKAKKRGVQLILVGDSSNKTELLSLAHEIDGSIPLLMASRESTSFLEDYKGTITPSYCLVDEQGIVRATGVGLLGLEVHL